MPLHMSGYVRVCPYRFEAYNPGAELAETRKRGQHPDAHYIRSGPDGFRYRGYVNENRTAKATVVDVPAPSRITEWFDTEMIQVASGDVIQMRNEHFQTILDGINAKVRTRRWAIVLPIAAALVIVGLTLRFGLHVLGTLALPLGFAGRMFSSDRRVTVLLYDLDDSALDAFGRVTEAFDLMMGCSGQWRIEAGTAVSDLATWKRNSGASHLVQKNPITLGYSLPDVIVSNITPPALQVGDKVIYFFPDVALVHDGQTFGAVGYADLSVTWQVSNSTELDAVPDDAVVVGRVWEHPNKNGGPDRRYKDSRQIPICSYEALHIASASGVNELVEFSRVGVAQAFADAIKCLPWQSLDAAPSALPTDERDLLLRSGAASIAPLPKSVDVLGRALGFT